MASNIVGQWLKAHAMEPTSLDSNLNFTSSFSNVLDLSKLQFSYLKNKNNNRQLRGGPSEKVM